MKLKTLLILAALAALLGGGAWWTARQQRAAPPPSIGARVLPPFPINEVSKITMLAPGTNITLVKTQEIWTVASRFNYPAKFAKVSECIQELDNLTIGQTIAAAPSQLGAFNLLAPSTNGAPDPTGQAGTLLQLFNAKDQLLAALVIGKHFQRRPPAGQAPGAFPGSEGYPDGQYVRTGEDQVLLVAKNLDRLVENIRFWLDDEFINVPAADILEMNLAGPGRAPMVLRRSRENEQLTLESSGAGEAAADAGKVSQIASALNYLGFDDVADPALTPKETGLDQPVTVTARTRQGWLYTVKIGNALTNDSFDRYAQVQVAFEPPPADQPAAPAAGAADQPGEEAQRQKADAVQAQADQAKALNRKLGPWTFTLKSYRAESLLIKREELIKPPEPAGKDELSTGAAAPPPAAVPAKATLSRKDE